MRTAQVLRRGAAERLTRIDAILESAYETSEGELGNKEDPLDEAIYIILSFQTDLRRFSSTWSSLRAAYPTWDAVERAPVRKIASVLREGGLHRQKARTIKQFLLAVRRFAGGLSLDALRGMNDADAEQILTRLPGLSWKGARCVLLYSLQRNAFPVDGNTFRVLKRSGILAAHAVYRRRTSHDAIQAVVPPTRRRSLHVNLVVHGQRTCLPRYPRCAECGLFSTCPRVGLPRMRMREPMASRQEEIGRLV
ncbi:MAG: endonuclease III [Deltaproteobacteria bacterium]|nr:endonuclease III [Deltaproteobacteria bacterium]